MKPIRLLLACTLIALNISNLSAQSNAARQEYIRRYADMAVRERDLYGIPASITLAQGLLESDNGRSRLATQANNHFGIKCRDWNGPTILHDDDAPQECFRSYADPEGSYRDHSEFLTKSARYAPLFQIPITDYQGWAYGLKAAGYATNPQYATLLITIIEDHQLYLLDDPDRQRETLPQAPPRAASQPARPPVTADPLEWNPTAGQVDIDNYSVSLRTHSGYPLYPNNGSEFILARPTDSWASIAEAFHVSVKKLLKYNDATSAIKLVAGEMVYVQPKAKRTNNGRVIHVATQGQTLRAVSQQYGVRLNSLAKLNLRNANAVLSEGQQIRLR